MKKSLLALAVLASAAGAAQAASSVTLYGTVDVGYEKFSNSNQSLSNNGAGNSGFNQTGNDDSNFGIKGEEDLGNGLSAIFKLESRLNADTGTQARSRFFERESWVGLKGSFGTVRFGRSQGAMERALGDYNPGNRVATIWDNYNSDFGSLGNTSTRVDNSAFYDYDNGGFNIGANVTTKGGAREVEDGYEGLKGSKMGYGVHASYAGNISTNVGYSVAAAYQKNGSRGFDVNGKGREWGAAAEVSFKPVAVGGSYADFKNSDFNLKQRTWGAYITADLTANDSLYVKYLSKRAKVAGSQISKDDMFALGVSHSLSKRTSVYADVARYRNRLVDGAKTTGFDIAMRHKF